MVKKKELCIVHIGMPKTGTSALQESLFTKIIDKRVSYANLPVSNHSAILFSMFSSCPESHNIHKSLKNSKDKIEQFNKKNKNLLIEGFTKNQTEIEIISGEDIFHIDEKGLYEMKSFLEKYFIKILIVGYVRSPKSFMESAFQQLVKYHGLGSFDFSIIYPHYRAKLEKFDIVFGVENVKLWKFDPKNFPKNDITLDFCNKLGIKTNSKLVTRANDSISQEAIALLFTNNKYGYSFDFDKLNLQINNKVVDVVSQIGNTKFRFSKELMKTVFELYEDDLEWIEKKMSTSLKEDLNQSNEGIKSEQELLEVAEQINNKLKKIVLDKCKKNQKFEVSSLIDILKLTIKSELQTPVSTKTKKTSQEQIKEEYAIISNFNINWDTYFYDNDIIEKSDPILHYIQNWDTKDLIIKDFFDTHYYLNRYPDIKKAGINPLIHFLRHGIEEGRKGIEEK